MHYVTSRSQRMQKHKFGVTCLGALFMETTPDPPEHEKGCIDVSCPKCTRIHNVTGRSHWMQKYKFGVTCLARAFCRIRTGPTSV
jgi:hypothetical protein